MNISAEEFHIHFISYANIPFKAGIYASDLSIDWGDGTSSILYLYCFYCFFHVLKNPRKILKQKVMNPDEFFHRLPITGSILVF